ncbi:MAG: hypothetical protein AB8B53_00665, partial [Flavobacteriales bacterium]
MKLINLLIGLVMSASAFSQTIYFNDIQSQDWNTTLVTNVEVYEEHYYIYGAFSNEDTFQGTFIQKLDLSGAFVANIFVVDSILVPNYAESINVSDNQIIIGGGRSALNLSSDNGVNWNYYKFFEDLYMNDIFMSSFLSDSSCLFIGSKIYDIDQDPSPEYSDVYLLKTSSEGEELWENEFNILPDKFIRISVIHELENGELVLVGSTYSPWNPVIIRVDSLGNLISYEQFGQEEENNWLPWSVLEEDGDVLTLASLTVEGVDEDFGDLSALQVMQYDLNTDSFIYESDFDDAYIFNHVQDF